MDMKLANDVQKSEDIKWYRSLQSTTKTYLSRYTKYVSYFFLCFCPKNVSYIQYIASTRWYQTLSIYKNLTQCWHFTDHLKNFKKIAEASKINKW